MRSGSYGPIWASPVSDSLFCSISITVTVVLTYNPFWFFDFAFPCFLFLYSK